MNGVNGALCRLLSIVQKNMFVEGKIENWIIFIDTNNMGVLEHDFKVGFLKQIKLDFVSLAIDLFWLLSSQKRQLERSWNVW